MKGQEMIGSMILGYFANGLYQLLCLFIFDNIIPINNPNLTIKGLHRHCQHHRPLPR